MDNWKFILIFHNLSVSEKIGNDYIIVVPFDDPMTDHIRSRSKEFSTFINNFKDQFDRPCHPSILFIRSDIQLDIESIVSFRNALAISSISNTWARVLSHGSQFDHLKYSDYFNFYPYSLSNDEKYLIARTPSVMSLDVVDKFQGQYSPGLAIIHADRNFYDNSLFNNLLLKWNELFIKKKKRTWALIALFRSLEMAYRASAMPFGNHGSIHDYGASISLWVSSIESLVHPENNYVGVNKVLNFLGEIYFCSDSLRRNKYRVKTKKGFRSLTLVQKTYFEMNNARNAFLHGNPVSIKSLYPTGNRKFPPLNFCAPIIYKYALEKFMGVNKEFDLGDVSEIAQYMLHRNSEEALKNIRKVVK